MGNCTTCGMRDRSISFFSNLGHSIERGIRHENSPDHDTQLTPQLATLLIDALGQPSVGQDHSTSRNSNALL
ncbi:hypothetical protein TNCV_4395831 [Trichonephila clavipes]|uniref:Uncharacterized protein n=1 Tax=Trichonephila clavipes TaxID=2585209 RepID=A0A8X7BF24_TRICX|nr:hypothetical protein TNCV_4395831 [Trichonephila clavipes]